MSEGSWFQSLDATAEKAQLLVLSLLASFEISALGHPTWGEEFGRAVLGGRL